MQKSIARVFVKPVGIALLGGLLTGLPACSSSLWQKLVTAVESHLGETLAQLEQLVAQYFPQYATDAGALDSILQAVLSLLQTTGVLPPPAAARANELQVQIGAKLAAAKKKE